MNARKNYELIAASYVLAVLVIITWGVTFVCTRYLLTSFSSLEILIIRFAIAYVSLWCFAPRVLHLKEPHDELLFMGAGLCGVTVYQFLENVAISFTSAHNVSIIVSTCPMFTAIIMQIFMHEKNIRPRFICGFIIAMAGIVLVTFNGTVRLHLSPAGDLLALAAAFCWAFYSLFVSKINRAGYPSLIATRRIFFWAVVFMIPLVAAGNLLHLGPEFHVELSAARNAHRWSDWKNIANLILLGFGASALCFAAWSRACLTLGTLRVTVGIYLIPAVTIVCAFLVLGERITLMGMAGAALTICGLFISASGKGARQAGGTS